MHIIAAHFATWTSLQQACFFFPLGLAVGSFCGAMWYRVPRGQSLVRPGSHCTICTHSLSAADLIPVLSFLLLGGRCRYCKTALSWHYPAAELLCGITAAAAGYAGGWIGGAIALSAWPLGAMMASVGLRRRLVQDQRGFTLVEVLVSCLLLAAVVASIFQSLNVSRKNTRAAHQRTLAVGLAREGLALAAEEIRRTAGSAAAGTVTHPVYPQYQITTTSGDFPAQAGSCWIATVRVECADCREVASSVKVSEVVCK